MNKPGPKCLGSLPMQDNQALSLNGLWVSTGAAGGGCPWDAPLGPQETSLDSSSQGGPHPRGPLGRMSCGFREGGALLPDSSLGSSPSLLSYHSSYTSAGAQTLPLVTSFLVTWSQTLTKDLYLRKIGRLSQHMGQFC